MIFGGRSEIGIELATRLAPGATVVLAARRADELTSRSRPCGRPGPRPCTCVEFDADELDSHGPLVDAIIAEHGPIGTAVLAFGILGDQARAEEGRGACRRDRAHRLRRSGQPADGAGHHHAGGRAPERDRRVLVGGRGPGAPGQLRLRVGEGRARRLRQRAGRRAARHRGACCCSCGRASSSGG